MPIAHFTYCWRKKNRIDHSISYLDTLMKTLSESIVVIMRRRWILFNGFVPRMEHTRLSKCGMIGEIVGGRGLCEGTGKIVGGVGPGRLPRSLRYQRRPMDDRSPGQEGMTQDGGTRGCAQGGSLWNRAFVKGVCSPRSCSIYSSRRL